MVNFNQQIPGIIQMNSEFYLTLLEYYEFLVFTLGFADVIGKVSRVESGSIFFDIKNVQIQSNFGATRLLSNVKIQIKICFKEILRLLLLRFSFLLFINETFT